MAQPPETEWLQNMPAWVWALMSPVAAWLGYRRAARTASADALATDGNNASAQVIDLLRAEVQRLSERVAALELREGQLRDELHQAKRLLANAGITQPGQLGD